MPDPTPTPSPSPTQRASTPRRPLPGAPGPLARLVDAAHCATVRRT